MGFGFLHLDGPYKLCDGASGERFQFHVQQTATDAEMGCDFSYSEVFLGEVRHNQFHQFFHEYFIPRVVGYLLDIQFFRLFEVLNTLFPAFLDILYQQFQVLGVERFGDIRVLTRTTVLRVVLPAAG